MAKKSKPESEQYAEDCDLARKKLKTRSSDTKEAMAEGTPGADMIPDVAQEVVKESESKKAEKSKKRKRNESIDKPAAPSSIDKDTSVAAKVERKKKKKKKHGDTVGLEDPGARIANASSGQVVADDHEVPHKKKKKSKKAKPSIDPPPENSSTPKKGKKKSKKFHSTTIDETSIPELTDPGSAKSAGDVAVEPSPADESPTTGDHGWKHHGSGTPQEPAKAKGVIGSFRRVKSEEWVGKRGSMDNTYEGTFGAAGWGFKAQQVLGQVRGKDFRHEKTKKKRGSYMGGKIDSSARFSFKYDSD